MMGTEFVHLVYIIYQFIFVVVYKQSPLYTSSKEHIKNTGRHRRASTPPEQWKMWDISFPDTDDEN